MAKLIHTADLHISVAEKDYCYAVLDEILALARAEKAGFLIIAGDLFDSYADFEALRKEVRTKLFRLHEEGCRTIYIPGNHEGRGAAADLGAYSLDPVQFYAKQPFVFFEAEGVEFVCVPHAANYDGYRDWKVPPKREGAARLAVVHALNSTIYTGPDEEADAKAGVIEDDFFARFAIDYAAMGHVHSGREQRLGGAVACYPGSPRVWRAHAREAGPRSVRVLDINGTTITSREVVMKSAGQYREYYLAMGIDGALDLVGLHKIEDQAGKLDLVDVKITGVVEDERAAAAEAEKLRARLAANCRLAEVELHTKVAADISTNGLARNFLAEMELLKPEPDEAEANRRWLLARQYGLEEIAAGLGGAK